jgi:hypothetical protein
MKSKKSAVRFSGTSTDFLHNKYILYLSFFFAILTAARYLFNFNLEAIIIFVVLGFLTTYFSKNMIVVLLTTTIGTNFIMMFKNKSSPTYYNIMEGMESGSGGAAPPAAAPPAAGAAAAAPPAAAAAAAPPAGAAAATGGAPPMATSDMVKKLTSAMSAMNAGSPSVAPIQANNSAPMPGIAAPANASKDAFTKKRSEAMTQLTPASYDGSSGDNALSSMFSGMAAGATGQKNQAYDVMNSLGSGANTGNLLGQQTEMINNLKSIEPILNTAEKFLDKFENSSISKMFQNMGSIPGMSLLTGGGGNGGGNGLNPASVGS